jgi:hypothetical protein
VVPEGLIIPPDLGIFFELCGGVDLYVGRDYAISVVGPQDLMSSNLAVIGEDFPDDNSAAWFTIAVTPDRDYLSIDLSLDRNGRCYDSFHEVHGVVGSCSVVACSFTELLENLLNSGGGHWYWLAPDFVSLGDAYD